MSTPPEMATYLRRLAVATAPASSPAPSFGQPAVSRFASLFWRWRSRKLEKLMRHGEPFRASADLINAKLAEAQARRLLAELTLTADTPPSPAVAPAPGNPALSLAELEQLINAMHELDPAQRAALLRLLAQRDEEKRP